MTDREHAEAECPRCSPPSKCPRCFEPFPHSHDDCHDTLIARAFHETYEALAPGHGYQTRPESNVQWQDVPENNRALMRSTVRSLIERGVIRT